MGGSLRGTKARRVQFWPVAGRARQLLLSPAEAPIPVPCPVPVRPSADAGQDVELF